MMGVLFAASFGLVDGLTAAWRWHAATFHHWQRYQMFGCSAGDTCASFVGTHSPSPWTLELSEAWS